MKITRKTLMVNFETEVKLGNNDAIELTLEHNAFIYESKSGDIEFDSESDYREKLVTLRESYFPSNAGTQREVTENLSESVEYPETPQVSGAMESYLSVLSRTTK